MLNNFFRINMPYGISQNEKGEWIAFNREYMPLGYNTSKDSKPITEYGDQPIYSKFKGLTEKFLEKILDDPSTITKDNEGRIVHVFFYKDANNPSNPGNSMYWDRYFNILKKLAVLEIKK